MRKRSDEKYCLKIIEEIYPLRIFPLYLHDEPQAVKFLSRNLIS